MTIDEERAEVCRVAATYVGTPYHHHGMIKGVGVDCATILILVYSEAGLIEPYDPGEYSEQWFLHRQDDLYLQHLLKFAVEVETPKQGDVVLFKIARQFAHGGIVTAWPMMIHAYKPDRLVLPGDGTQGEFSDVKASPRRFFTLKRWAN